MKTGNGVGAWRILFAKAASKKLAWFTLVELIVVITILAILATIGFLALSGYAQDAKDSVVKANVRSVVTVIASESAITNNSPRYYVVHDTGASLADGTVAYVNGDPVTLTGGQYGTANTNYSAGNPDWAKLKLNPDKFRLSSLGSRFAAAFGTAEAAYDSKAVSVGAMDAALTPAANGRSRSASFYQVTGTAPATGVVTVSGTFPAPTAAETASGAIAGLVKSPAGTGALVDGASSTGGSSSSSSSSSSSGGGTCAPSAYVAGTAYSAGQCFTYALPSGSSVTVNVQGTGVGTVAGTKSLHTPACDTDDIAIWGTSGNPQVWAACNVGATNAMPYADMKFDGTTNDANVSIATNVGGIYQWGANANVRSASTLPASATTNDSWGNTANTDVARLGPCSTGYHVPNGWRNGGNTADIVGANEWENAYLIAATAGAGTSCDPATMANQHHRIRCLLRLPRSGYRRSSDSSWTDLGSYGYYWSSSPNSTNGRYAYFHASGGNIASSSNRASGVSVRCLKN